MAIRHFSILLLCLPLLCAQPPAGTQATLDRARERALQYVSSLPDFICTEQIDRFFDTSQKGLWKRLDVLTVKLSYFQKYEDHKLLEIDGKPTDQPFERLSGETGKGEFGGTLRSVFEPESQAVFKFEGWKTLRKRKLAAYSYVVRQERSRYDIVSAVRGSPAEATVGFHGTLEVDPESGDVLHFTYEADRIPATLGINYAATRVDYEPAEVGGRQYLLPAHSETELRTSKYSTRNVMDFRDYRKFSSSSTIDFGVGK